MEGAEVMKRFMRFAGLIAVVGGSLGMAATPALALQPAAAATDRPERLGESAAVPVLGQKGFLDPQPLRPIVD